MQSLLIRSLDEAIFEFRIATQRPAYRSRLLAGVDFEGGIASLRLLRSVERLTTDGNDPAIRHVANDLGIEHSTASRSVDAQVRVGLLSRTKCAHDLRQARLQLTAHGMATLRAATAHRQEILASLVGDWPEEDLRTLTQLLARLRDDFDEEFGGR